MHLNTSIKRRTAIALAAGSTVAAVCGSGTAFASESEQQSSEAVEFLYLDELTVAQGQEEHFVASLNEADGIVDATLYVIEVTSGKELSYPLSNSTDSALLFSFVLEDEGDYAVSACSVTDASGEREISFSDADQSCLTFSVVPGDTLVSTQSLDGPSDVSTDVYASDGSESVVQVDSIEEGIGATSQDVNPASFEKSSRTSLHAGIFYKGGSSAKQAKSSNGSLVIGIDPGHSVGSGNSGAVGVNGAWESSCTWKIACYCRDELETYSNVEVVFSKDYDNDPDLPVRVQNLVNAGADVVVSIHLNSTYGGSNGTAHGAEVWVPYSTEYNYQTHVVGKDLGDKIVSELAKLGLSNRGSKVKTASGDQYKYDDGSDGDYYGIIRYARKAGIPGIIVEHAFIDNRNDYYNFLSDDGKLRNLGLADARGIAEAYGLTRSNGTSASLYRLYNPNDGQHHYTADANERDVLSSIGWKYEGVAWRSPSKSSTPVYRLYNPNNGDHHYTTDANEYRTLPSCGWRQEGVAWYSDDAKGQPLYRLFNPNASVGTHHYTADANEKNVLSSIGWRYEGVAWYGMADDGVTETPIASPTSVSASKMAELFKETCGTDAYPSVVYAQYGASSIDDFCSILVQEADAEGVNGSVVFAQTMLETGYLKFGGDAKADQCNFCGLGVTGGGNPGLSFNTYGKDSVRMGLRAQVQHLKAYGSTDPLKNACIDPRFDYVKRGCAPYVENLGNGKWATDPAYADKLLKIIRQLKAL